MQNSAVRLKAIKTGGNSMNPTPAMSLNLLSGAISSLVTFSRSSVATVTDFEGVIKNTKINEARFDGMRRVENLLTYSQDFSNAAWSKTNSTITTGITAPDGTLTANKIIANAVNGGHSVLQVAIPLGVVTASFYVKAGEYSQIFIEAYNASQSQYSHFNLTTNVVINYGSTSSSITDVGNGWKRCVVTYTRTFTGQLIFWTLNNTGQQVYIGDGYSGIYIWGAQLENVTGQTNQNPSEYISTNVLSYPYQGAGVDGVQYFPYTNPNCVINGAITQIPTTPINSSNSKWAYNCTTAGDYFSTPSSTANRITGDLSLLAQVALDDWTPTTVQCLIVKDGVSAGTRSWAFNVQTSGAPRLNYSLDGTNILSATATVATGFTDRTVHYVGVQRESSTGIIRFYTSEDGRTFTQLGADVAGTAGALYDATTQPVQFGNLSGLSFALDGKIYDSHVYSGLKFTGTSTMVMDFDPSNWTTGTTFTGLETGEVWTLNGNAKIYQGLWDATGPSSLLIEESRTNLLTYSGDFSNAAWGKTEVTIGSNSIAPDGSSSANQLVETAVTNNHLVALPTTLLLNNAYVLSVYVKKGTLSTAPNSIQLYTNFSSQAFANFDISTGALGTVGSAATASITSVGNGWYRCLIRVTVTSVSACNGFILFNNNNLSASAAPSYLGAVTSDVYIWGAQLEAGSFATSYIPTTSAAVTRTADQASMTGTNFSSWYNQAQGSLYVGFDLIGLQKASQGMDIVNVLNASGYGVELYNNTTGTIISSYLGVSNSGVINPPAINTKYQALLAYTQTNLNTCINGATPITLSGTLPASIISLGLGFAQTTNANYMSGHIRKINYYATALPSAVLQSLTS